ncbi:hypothetical protein HDU98_003016, partial [Podochytrium sp. JEL0797]
MHVATPPHVSDGVRAHPNRSPVPVEDSEHVSSAGKSTQPHFDAIRKMKVDVGNKLKFLLTNQPRPSRAAEPTSHHAAATNGHTAEPPNEFALAGLKSQQYLASKFSKCGGSYVAVTHKWGAVSNLYDESPKSHKHSTPVSDLSKLRMLQQLVAAGDVWIDIYDNEQEDGSLKSAQVQLMGEVYFYADWVLWVTTARDDQTLCLLEEIDGADIACWAKKESARILSWKPVRGSVTGGPTDAIGAFEHWTRAWTYQEIVLANSVHAYSPYSDRDWSISRILRKVRDIWPKLGKADKLYESKEVKRLRLLIRASLNDLEIMSQARPDHAHSHGTGKKAHRSQIQKHRLLREIQTPRVATRAIDILFSHLWTFGVPKGVLDYSRDVEWNVRQFSAYLICSGQMTIAANQIVPSGIQNACWVPLELLGLIELHKNKKEGSTAVLKMVKVERSREPLDFVVLEDGKLQVTTRVKQLHDDVWIAYLNERESVVFLKQKCHVVSVTDSEWDWEENELEDPKGKKHSTVTATVKFGASSVEIGRPRQFIETGATMLETLAWQDGVGWSASFALALDYLMELRPLIDDADVYGIVKSVLSTEDSFDSFAQCVLEAAEIACLNGVALHLICEAVEILFALSGKFACCLDGKSNAVQYFALLGQEVVGSEDDTPLKIYDLSNAIMDDAVMAL